MMAHYQILEWVGTTAGSHLHRGRAVADGAPVLLKLPLSDDMAPRLRREYTLLAVLDIPGVAKPVALAGEPGQPMMVLPPIEGEHFELALARQKPDLGRALRLGLQLLHILAGLHGARLVHRDVRPANLMLLPHDRLCLLDLSMAASEPQAAPPAGDWAYISPEQTGRMNREVDYRTDFYSLGVTLYRMLTGQLPCHGNDALEWAHCHLASVPRAPADIDAAIPPALSALVLKLLEKMPEDRYQSAHGLQADLERCLAQWQAEGSIAPFDLGAHDMAEHLQIPRTLVGREAELAQLLACHDAMAASGHAAMALVSGGAGVGKSALAHALREPVMERHGLFIAAKFDQFQSDIAYDTVTQAFRELVQQILLEDEAGVAAWRRQLQEALGANAQVMVEVLPQLELVIGPQPPLPQLAPAEAQNRYRMVFQKFIGVFARQAHPLTLLLDDLQWADAASLALLRELLTARARRFLLVVGACRDNHPPLAQALDAMRKDGAAITEIALAPLPEAALGDYLAELLHCERDAAAPLAQLVHQKTGGNPFFMIQFIGALADEGMIAFDPASRSWRWDLARIGAQGYTDNVAELMVGKLARLPAPAQALLQTLACLGPGAPKATLVMLSGQPEAATEAALGAAVRAALVVQTDGMVSFLHDRVREAAYLSLPEAERQALHLRIGRRLIAGKTARQVEEDVFAIVSQFNRGAGAIVDEGEQALLCRLNLLAGKKAKQGFALAAARSFLDRALAAMPADMWQTAYQDSLELVLALSECEYIGGNFARAEELADLVLAHAQSRRDSARVYLLRIALYQVAGRLDDAVASMVEGARLFDVVFPADEAEIETAIEDEIGAISAELHGRRIADLAAGRALADPDMGMALAVLVEAIPAAYMVRPAYFSLIITTAVRLSLRHGHNEDACFAYSAYGILLLARRRDIPAALAFSDLALQLNERLGGRRRKGRLLATHAIAYSLLRDPLAQAATLLDQGFGASLEVGDLVYASYITMVYFWLRLQQGVALGEVLQETAPHADFARDCHNEVVLQTLRFEQQLVANLQGRTRSPHSLDDGDFDGAACLAMLEQASFGFGLQSAHIIGQVSAFIYGDHAGALEAARRAARHSHESANLILFDAVHHFFFALTLAALYPQAPGDRQRELAAQLTDEFDRHAMWAASCPRNFADRHALLGAELARIEGRADDAAQLYQQAIDGAQERGYVQDLAIACELAAAFYQARGFVLIADTYLREARGAYARWGAAGKVAQLDERHPHLLAPLSMAAPGFDMARLDLLSVVKASQAISSRILLADLVDTLMHIVLENAGAQRACLLLARGDALVPAAEAGVGKAGGSLPASVINYVRRSREQVLLPDVAQPNPFSGDPYFSSQQPKSVLCLPILRQDALAGLIYLENDLVTHAFAPVPVAVLQLLASQAAISLENAGLYADLQEREAKLRRMFESNIVAIFYYCLDGRITDANDAALDLIQYSRDELRAGKIRWPNMTAPEWRPADERALAELERTGTCRPFEKEIVRKDGSRVPILVTAARFEGSRDQGGAFVLDLSERKRAEQQVRHMANHDELTGLPNRTLLHDRLNQAISVAHRNGGRVGILFIDLDFFKIINDSLGHQIGDVVLQMTAGRLQECLREGDSVARLGGDEFVIVLPAVGDSGDTVLVAQKALDMLAQSFVVDNHELHLGASIGISLYPDDGADVEALMRTADTAMYHAKETGRGKFQFFTAALNQMAQQRLEVGARLRHALLHDEFVLHYQPQVDMQSGRIFAAEALLRWQQPGAAPISCGTFIGNAEESGLIVPIGEWTLRQACRQLRLWRDGGRPDLKIAVNLSPRQLEPADFCDLVARILDETGIPPDALELEITESIFLQRSDLNLSTLTALRDMGIRLSVDDFGTGYSSLAYLQRFPVHALKIDQSFVRDIGTDRNHTALITAIIAMADSLQLGVMAEGVETGEQASFLLAHGCRAAQGYYYSEAVPAQAFSSLLDSRPAPR